MDDRRGEGEWHFNLALASIVLPVGAFVVSTALALHALTRRDPGPEHRAWTRRLVGLAGVDLLVGVAMILLLIGRAKWPEPAPAPAVPSAPHPLFQVEGPGEPFPSAVGSLFLAWASVAALLAILAAVAAHRRAPVEPSPPRFWLLFAGGLAASDAALVGTYAILRKILGGASLGGSLVALVAGSGTLLVFAAVARRLLGWGRDPGGASVPATVILGVGYMIAGVIRVGIVLAGLGPLLHLPRIDPSREIGDMVSRGMGPVAVGLLVFAAVILAPIGEETLFRGILLPWLRRFLHPELALWASAVLFGIGHLRYGPYLITIVVYGLVLGWARTRTGNLRASIALHMIINGVATAVALLRA
jgi:uncharacterized protein